MVEDIAGRVREYVDQNYREVDGLEEAEAVTALIRGMEAPGALGGWDAEDVRHYLIGDREQIGERLRRCRSL